MQPLDFRIFPASIPKLSTHTMKVDVRLPGKGNSNSHGARPVYIIISMIKWIRTSRLSIKNSLSQPAQAYPAALPRESRADTILNLTSTTHLE